MKKNINLKNLKKKKKGIKFNRKKLMEDDIIYIYIYIYIYINNLKNDPK
jgi:hypothetical protein